MDQFGLNMTFLGIKQVSVIIFVLKIFYSINFYDSPIHWTAPQLNRNAGANSKDSPDPGNSRTRTAGWFL
jgi:hypothetical protein